MRLKHKYVPGEWDLITVSDIFTLSNEKAPIS